MSELTIRQLPLGQLQANAYLVYLEGRSDALVIDPGDDLDCIEQELSCSGRSLTHILLTHGHFDHMLAAAELKKRHSASIHIHPYDSHMLQSAGASLYIPAYCRLPFTPAEANEPYPATDEDWPLEVCGISFTGFRTPGHTPGSVCLLDAEHKALFTGDTIFAYGYGRTDFDGGSVDDMRMSLARLLDMDGELTVYSGHGEADTMSAIASRWRR